MKKYLFILLVVALTSCELYEPVEYQEIQTTQVSDIYMAIDTIETIDSVGIDVTYWPRDTLPFAIVSIKSYPSPQNRGVTTYHITQCDYNYYVLFKNIKKDEYLVVKYSTKDNRHYYGWFNYPRHIIHNSKCTIGWCDESKDHYIQFEGFPTFDTINNNIRYFNNNEIMLRYIY